MQPPKLTIPMVARVQGWQSDDPEHETWLHNLSGRKTAQYRQIGNAFPPPDARAVGQRIFAALRHQGVPKQMPEPDDVSQDRVYAVLRNARGYLTAERIVTATGESLDRPSFERRLAHLAADFEIDVKATPRGLAYKLGAFKAFTGQAGHRRDEFLVRHRSKVS